MLDSTQFKKILKQNIIYIAHIISRLTIPLLKKLNWNVVFVINIGSSTNYYQYLPNTIAAKYSRSDKYLTSTFPIALINGRNFKGVMLLNGASNQMLTSNRNFIGKIMQNVIGYKSSRYAMGSVIPSVYTSQKKADLPINNEDIVTSHAGLIYMMAGCMLQAVERYPDYRLLERPIAIIGAGYSGLSLAKYLNDEGFEVNVFDIREVQQKTSKDIPIYVNKFKGIGKSGMIFLLSTDGESGFNSIKDYLTPNMVLLSNTFPHLQDSNILGIRQKGVHCFETYTHIPGIRVFPSFFNIEPQHFGGCFIQSYLESINQKHYKDDVQAFTTDANKIGMAPYLKEL